jgi:hypothetical protein
MGNSNIILSDNTSSADSENYIPNDFELHPLVIKSLQAWEQFNQTTYLTIFGKNKVALDKN